MRFLLFLLNFGLLTGALAENFEVHYTPLRPSFDDVVEIEIRGVTQGGTLHWGVNAVGTVWEQAIPPYRPDGSEVAGVATRTRLQGPDENGVSRITLGPFNNTNQQIRALNFAIQWDDGTWSNKDEKNFNLPISFGRIAVTPEHPTVNDQILVHVRRSRTGGQLRWGVNAENDMWQPPTNFYWPKGTVPAKDGLAVDSPLSAPDKKDFRPLHSAHSIAPSRSCAHCTWPCIGAMIGIPTPGAITTSPSLSMPARTHHPLIFSRHKMTKRWWTRQTLSWSQTGQTKWSCD
ncbi:MAG: hypothetical protein M5U15_07995 [Kiritimatiellae bacterium]|nr:hypothetical protein [Kiritimatiellia bacterium]